MTGFFGAAVGNFFRPLIRRYTQSFLRRVAGPTPISVICATKIKSLRVTVDIMISDAKTTEEEGEEKKRGGVEATLS